MSESKPNSQVKHCVLLKFKSATPAGVRRVIFQKLNGLMQKNLGILEMVHGSFSSSPGPNGPTSQAQGFTDGLVVTFRSIEDRNRYNIDPTHQGILNDDILPNLEDGGQGLVRFDFVETVS